MFIVTAIFLAASLICLVVNYSVSGRIGWSLIPVGGLVLVWATIAPLLAMKKNRALRSFIGLTVTLIPYLFLLESMSSAKDWVLPLALPVAGLSLLALGISLIAFAYMKSNLFYPAALTVFLFGVIVNFGVGLIVRNFIGEEHYMDISKIWTLACSAILSLALVLMGLLQNNKKPLS